MPLYDLTYDNVDLSVDNGFIVVNVPAGLGASETITTMTTTSDGSTFVTSRTPERQIIITLKAFTHADRQRIYDLFTAKTEAKQLTYEPVDGSTEKRVINCRVSAVRPLKSEFPMNVQVTLLATSPSWMSENVSTTGITGEIDADFKFDIELPEDDVFVFSEELTGNSRYVDYSGTVPAGVKIRVRFSTAKTFFRIQNHTTNEEMSIDYDFEADSELEIWTVAGQKSILYRSADAIESINILDSLRFGSKFIRLVHGRNRIFVDSDDGTFGIDVSVDYQALHGGV